MADAERLNVATQDGDPLSTLAFARRLLALRRELRALQGGTQRSVDAAPGIFCFLREHDERFLVALNFTSRAAPLALGEDLGQAARLELSTDLTREPGQIDRGELVLAPDEGVLLRLV